MANLENWQAVAFNPATESTNQIHSDEMAKAYGFRGGLVPGVTISGYLMHPAVLAWGEQWLSHGAAEVTVHKPLYEGVPFEVEVEQVNDTQANVQLVDAEGALNATGSLRLNDSNAVGEPIYRGDALLNPDEDMPSAVPEVMRGLQQSGMRALPIRWDDSHNMAVYLKNEAHMAKLHRPSENGFAHGAFLLGITNWVLMGNAYMNPWVHLQTSSQYFRSVPYGTDLIAECQIEDLFEKKGHDFVDVLVNIFEAESKLPVMSGKLRAIYRMRPA